jgi:FkbM family methyltransferase
MNQISSQHPALRAFDSALDLRTHVAANPADLIGRFSAFCLAHMQQSSAQLFQDLFVLFALNLKKSGVFVEFGATNGMALSNTLLLERQFGWTGILAEPARCWHEALKANRKARIDLRCVWKVSGEQLEFNETTLPELSTITRYTDGDFNKAARTSASAYTVETVSLRDLLVAHDCPATIDYLSIDTEGSELEILRAFDFKAYAIDVLTVEHNFKEPERSEIQKLLAANGFTRVFEYFSKWDDWYLSQRVINPRR